MGRRSNKNNGGLCCVQASLVAFNFVTLLGGVATLAIGVWLFYESQAETPDELVVTTEVSEFIKDVTENDPFLRHNEFRGISILLIALGSLVTFISFLGCFGAFISSRCLLLSYLALVTVVLILQLILSTVVVIHRYPVHSAIRKELLRYVKEDYQPDGPIGHAWNLIQENLECCGVDGYKDWYEHDSWIGNYTVPDSCCLPSFNYTGCGKSGDPNNWFQQGCLPKMQLRIMEQLHFFATAVITLVFLQLYGIIASTLLFYHAKSIDKSKRRANNMPYKAYSYERAGMM